MKRWLWIAICALVASYGSGAFADEGEEERGREWRDGDVYVRELQLTPAPEPSPALKHRLLTDDFDRTDRNAAVYYLKAMGFLEQHHALREIFEREDEWRKESQERGEDRWAPYAWLEERPEDLPIDEVKDYLKLLSFQERFLDEASRCRHCDWENDIRGAENPVAVLLPEIQHTRELARMQVLRCKAALAEGRHEDAVRIMRETYELARHMGEHDCLVSTLVGIAIAGITTQNMYLDLIETPDSPNLYWAIAMMPEPLIDMTPAWSTEGRFLEQQFPAFQDVDETPRSVDYWRAFAENMFGDLRIAGELGLGFSMPPSDDPAARQASLAGFCLWAYPSSRQYLIDDCGMDEATVDAYPVMQVVALAMKRAWDELRDAEMKWIHVPPHLRKGDYDLMDRAREIGPASVIAVLLMPAWQACSNAQTRSQRDLAMIQTVEAIRAHLAEHGRFPESLDDLALPAPVDPYTNEPFYYRAPSRSDAVLESAESRRDYYKRRWILKVRK